MFQFLTDIIYWLEIPAVQDQNWHWIQHKDIFTNQIKRRLGILANHKNSLCSLHLLVATLKPLLNFRLGIYFCYNECKVWVNDYLKKGQTLLLPAYTGAKLWWDTLSFYFYSLEEATGESIQLLVWEFFSQCWGTTISLIWLNISMLLWKNFSIWNPCIYHPPSTHTHTHVCTCTHAHTHTRRCRHILIVT